MSNLPIDDKAVPPAKILLVEDSFANRDMLTRRLQRRGYIVCGAEDGATGVEMSVSEKPDLILMDVALGEMDGWTATRLIKSDIRTRSIPIIALTAHALASDREMSVEVGCADFDTKPVDLARLLGKIEGCLARTRASVSASAAATVAPSAAAGPAQTNHRGNNVARQGQLEGVQ